VSFEHATWLDWERGGGVGSLAGWEGSAVDVEQGDAAVCLWIWEYTGSIVTAGIFTSIHSSISIYYVTHPLYLPLNLSLKQVTMVKRL
jgi:hypothetical protein